MNDLSLQSEHNFSEAKRKLLESYFRGRDGCVQANPSRIVPRPAGEAAPLSPAQEQLWIQEQRAGGSLPYNESVTVKFNGPVNADVLRKSFAEIVRRHEIWRTSYDTLDGKLVQVIHPVPFSFPWDVFDLSGLPEVERQIELLRLTAEAARRPFDLRSGPLLRAIFVRLTEVDQRLLLFAHLSILDGVSVYQVLPSELSALYAAYSTSRPSPLPELPIQYADYASWQRQHIDKNGLANQLLYWRKQLTGELPVLRWPISSGRPGLQQFRGALQSFALSPSLTTSLRQQSRNERVTLFTMLVASFSALLYSYTGQHDLILGTPAAGGRKRSEVQTMLGYFLNPVALRFNLDGDPTFRELLLRVQQVIAEALTYDDVPIESLAEDLQLRQDTHRNPFFSVGVSLQPQTPKIATGLEVSSMDVDSGGSAWNMYLAFIDSEGGILGRMQYNPDRFEATAITQVIHDLENLMEVLCTNPDQRLSHRPRPELHNIA